MYPSRFRYEAPRSLAEAIELLVSGGEESKVLAGGQSLVPLMKLRFAAPELIVDINNLPGLDYHHADSLGLQLVDDLTQQLHGNIMVNREGGTTFTITFDTDRRVERER